VSPPVAENLRDHFREKIWQFGERRSYTFLRDTRDGVVEERRTYLELDLRARRIAAALSARMSRGDRLLLLYPQGLEFVEAFLGCLYAGIVAVPAPVAQFKRSADRIAGIVRDADIRVVLTAADAVEEITAQLAGLGAGGELDVAAVTEAAESGDESAWRAPALDRDGLVYLQYTSGSTSQPKGVMVTHANLLDNGGVIQRLWRTGSDSVIAGWIPHFHDMGLISLLLQPLHVGGDCVFTSPMSFVKRPACWLEMLTRFRGTATIAPDFGFDLCTRTVTDAQLSTLDLSGVRVMANGSEPVRHDTLTAFARRFAPAGFRPESFMPVYGLAEATLIIHSGHFGAGADRP
jgi:acyl-CoA synthetase (AMP-forming)/AMP-acid ligase II